MSATNRSPIINRIKQAISKQPPVLTEKTDYQKMIDKIDAQTPQGIEQSKIDAQIKAAEIKAASEKPTNWQKCKDVANAGGFLLNKTTETFNSLAKTVGYGLIAIAIHSGLTGEDITDVPHNFAQALEKNGGIKPSLDKMGHGMIEIYNASKISDLFEVNEPATAEPPYPKELNRLIPPSESGDEATTKGGQTGKDHNTDHRLIM